MRMYGTFWQLLDTEDKVELSVIIIGAVAMLLTVSGFGLAVYYLLFRYALS